MDISVYGFFGDFAATDDFDDLFVLDGGQSDTFTTDRTSIDIYLWHEHDGDQLLEGIVIAQDCDNDNGSSGNDGSSNSGSSGNGSDNGTTTGATNASGHPTVAPAAGIADANNSASALTAGIALLIGTTIAARRLRTHN